MLHNQTIRFNNKLLPVLSQKHVKSREALYQKEIEVLTAPWRYWRGGAPSLGLPWSPGPNCSRPHPCGRSIAVVVYTPKPQVTARAHKTVTRAGVP